MQENDINLKHICLDSESNTAEGCWLEQLLLGVELD